MYTMGYIIKNNIKYNNQLYDIASSINNYFTTIISATTQLITLKLITNIPSE